MNNQELLDKVKAWLANAEEQYKDAAPAKKIVALSLIYSLKSELGLIGVEPSTTQSQS